MGGAFPCLVMVLTLRYYYGIDVYALERLDLTICLQFIECKIFEGVNDQDFLFLNISMENRSL